MSASLSCSNGGSLPEFPEKPSREAYEGFEWETVTGAGLKFWAQKNGNIRMLADHSVPSTVMVRDGDASPATRIKIFSLETAQSMICSRYSASNPDGMRSRLACFRRFHQTEKVLKDIFSSLPENMRMKSIRSVKMNLFHQHAADGE